MKDRIVPPYVVTKDEYWTDPRIPTAQADDGSVPGIERQPTERVDETGAAEDQIELLTRVHGHVVAQDDHVENNLTRNSWTTLGAPSAEKIEPLPALTTGHNGIA
jgi:hypothetical protein